MSLDQDPPEPIRPLQALKALWALNRNPQDTLQVFRLTQALAGKRPHELRDRMRQHPMGLLRLKERRSLLETLTRRDWLSNLPVGTFGRTYHDFLQAQGLTAEGLVELSQEAFGHMADDGSDRYYLGRRIRDMHDLFHVLSGYGRDEVGEICVLAFSYPHQRTRSFGVIATAGAFALRRRFSHPGIPGAVRQAYRLGQQAQWLLPQPIETLLPRPLADIRRELGIGKPTRYLKVIEDLTQRGHYIPEPPGPFTSCTTP